MSRDRVTEALLEALKLAFRERLQAEPRNPIKKDDGSGRLEDTPDWSRNWKEGEYAGYTIEETQNGDEAVVFE